MKALKIFAFAAVAAVMAVSCGRSEVKVDVELPTKADADSVSYLAGIQLGSYLQGQLLVEDPSEINFAQVRRGMIDAIMAEAPQGYNDTNFVKQFKISPNEMQRIMYGYIQKKMEYLAEVNRVEGEKFLAENALKENVDTTDTGLQYTILSEGAAEKVAINDTVTVKYKGTFIDGTMFDEGQIPHHVSGSRGLVPGFDQGIRLLGEGGKAVIYLPSDLGYGRGGRGMEPNKVLIFDIEVVKVNKFVPKEEVSE